MRYLSRHKTIDFSLLTLKVSITRNLSTFVLINLWLISLVPRGIRFFFFNRDLYRICAYMYREIIKVPRNGFVAVEPEGKDDHL